MAEERVPSALESKPDPGLSSALERKAAELAAGVTSRTRARPPVRKLDFSTLEQSRFGLKGVFAGLFIFNAALIGGLMVADQHYKFSPHHHDNEWESISSTRKRFRMLREEREREEEEEEESSRRKSV